MGCRNVLFLLIVLAGAPLAQSASEYCSFEKAEGESCYRDCCESLGYSYDGGCLVSGTDQDYVSSSCLYCTDSYAQCVETYESGGSSGASNDYSSSGGSGCCSGFIVLSLLGASVFLRS
ncbi:hypothetical protein L0Y65_04885 [Candidatus Micrarchaeota archaeon]|nr:hypothetical protein [Candidatus Micrarchaeota archaeon]